MCLSEPLEGGSHRRLGDMATNHGVVPWQHALCICIAITLPSQTAGKHATITQTRIRGMPWL